MSIGRKISNPVAEGFLASPAHQPVFDRLHGPQQSSLREIAVGSKSIVDALSWRIRLIRLNRSHRGLLRQRKTPHCQDTEQNFGDVDGKLHLFAEYIPI